MREAKPVQFRVEPDLFTEAQEIADYEGFASVASMARYALKQYMNEVKESKVPLFDPNPQEIALFEQAEKEIKTGKSFKLDPERLEEQFA